MVWATTITIRGLSFELSGQDHQFDREGGVTVNPSIVDFDNPDFTQAFKIACSVYPVAQAYNEFQFLMRYFPKPYEVDGDTLDILKGYALMLQESGIKQWSMSQQMEEYLSAVEYYQHNPPPPRRAEKTLRVIKPGYVYLLQTETGVHKIGRTQEPKKRLYQFGITLPFTFECLCMIQTPDMNKLETDLHQKYADKRVNGEWFKLSAEDVEYIRSLGQVAS